MNDANFFAMRDQYMFICYKDIVKHCYPVMLKKLINEYYDDLLPYFYIDMIKDYDIHNLERLCTERTDINPLKYLKRENCTDETCDILLKTFEEEMIDMYTNSRFTEFGAKIFNIILQPQIKEIYIYVEQPINQIMYDCKVHFEQFGNKIKYVCGDFIDVIAKLPIKPTTYVLNDVLYIQKLIDNNFIKFTEVIIAELGYNFELDSKGDVVTKNNYEKLMEEKVFKIGYLPTIKLEQKHFTALIPKDE